VFRATIAWDFPLKVPRVRLTRVTVLDTLAYARQLKASGFTDAQAEGLANALGAVLTDRLAMREDVQALDQDVQVLKQDVHALKQDVQVLKQDVDVIKEDVRILKEDVRALREQIKAESRALEHKIEGVELRMQAALASLETRLTIRMGAMAAGTVALVTAIDRLF
jgi:chromosome segregation ATPase